jgi:hypothetical protein
MPAGLAQRETGSTALSEAETTVDSTVTYDFGQQITFSVHITSDVVVEQVHLFFRQVNETEARSATMDIEPGREVESSYQHDLRFSPMQPFATVLYWFHIEYAEGQTEPTITPPRMFVYDDNRFQWKHLAGEGVTVHWISGH